jgi:Tfp pilus assembly protein PilO
MNLNKREKILFLLAILSIVVPIVCFKIVIPYINKWHQQTVQINQKKELIKKAQEIITKKDSLTKRFSVLSKKIQAKLPLERKESEFLTEIGRVAENTYVHIETMNPLPFRDLDFFKELSVEINMEANLGNLARFLYEMRKSSVVLIANRLRLKPKSTRSALLKGHLVISTIFLKER